MQETELLGYIAAAVHAVVPGSLAGPGDSGFTDPKRLREVLARLTMEQRELVMLVLDAMIRERTRGYLARPLEANLP